MTIAKCWTILSRSYVWRIMLMQSWSLNSREVCRLGVIIIARASPRHQSCSYRAACCRVLPRLFLSFFSSCSYPCKRARTLRRPAACFDSQSANVVWHHTAAHAATGQPLLGNGDGRQNVYATGPCSLLAYLDGCLSNSAFQFPNFLVDKNICLLTNSTSDRPYHVALYCCCQELSVDELTTVAELAYRLKMAVDEQNEFLKSIDAWTGPAYFLHVTTKKSANGNRRTLAGEVTNCIEFYLLCGIFDLCKQQRGRGQWEWREFIFRLYRWCYIA